ncbi:hypothetical protein ABPG72_006757 [Tetrahymena utriculariae]
MIFSSGDLLAQTKLQCFDFLNSQKQFYTGGKHSCHARVLLKLSLLLQEMHDSKISIYFSLTRVPSILIKETGLLKLMAPNTVASQSLWYISLGANNLSGTTYQCWG